MHNLGITIFVKVQTYTSLLMQELILRSVGASYLMDNALFG